LQLRGGTSRENVVEALAAHVATYGAGREGLVFHLDNGNPADRRRLSRMMQAATSSAGVVATWHDLRHHHASTLLSAGVSPALVTERLGHDLETLLDTDAHVIRSDEDRVRAIVDRTLTLRAEDQLRTEAP
jgi:site-specific recombinase XerD